MGEPHKHSELIKLWADGAEIQVFHPNLDTWEDCTYNPSWNVNIKYRIKPEPKLDVVLFSIVYELNKRTLSQVLGTCTYVSNAHNVKLEDSNLKLIFDGETGKLKNSEVIK